MLWYGEYQPSTGGLTYVIAGDPRPSSPATASAAASWRLDRFVPDPARAEDDVCLLVVHREP